MLGVFGSTFKELGRVLSDIDLLYGILGRGPGGGLERIPATCYNVMFMVSKEKSARD